MTTPDLGQIFPNGQDKDTGGTWHCVITEMPDKPPDVYVSPMDKTYLEFSISPTDTKMKHLSYHILLFQTRAEVWQVQPRKCLKTLNIYITVIILKSIAYACKCNRYVTLKDQILKLNQIKMYSIERLIFFAWMSYLKLWFRGRWNQRWKWRDRFWW